jgi:SAM-dependent methyltransferase
MERASKDDNISKNLLERIEIPDIVCTADQIGNALRRKRASFDCIISCHNLEHIPNPILFLQECGKLLRDGGKVLLALPDKRQCYDYFRPVSTTADWIEAFIEKRKRPTGRQVFEHQSRHALRDGQCIWGPPSRPDDIDPLRTVRRAYDAWLVNCSNYVDCHCWVFTPESFALLILDCLYLGLIKLEIALNEMTKEGEFLVALSRFSGPLSESMYYEKRAALMKQEAQNYTAPIFPADKRAISPSRKSFLRLRS